MPHAMPINVFIQYKCLSLKGTSKDCNRFTATQLPPSILLLTDFQRAKYLGENMTPFTRVFLAHPSLSFKVQILSSSLDHLHVGFCQPFTPTPLRFNLVEWLLCRADTQLFECGKHGPV